MEKVIFDWGSNKDELNKQKHHISFNEAQYAFFDQYRILAEDLKHSQKEKRYFCIGKVDNGIVTVRFIYRGNTIRIIGAGYWRKGAKIYAEKNKIHK